MPCLFPNDGFLIILFRKKYLLMIDYNLQFILFSVHVGMKKKLNGRFKMKIIIIIILKNNILKI